MQLVPAAKMLILAGCVLMVATVLLSAWAATFRLSPLGWAGDIVMWGFALSVSAFAIGGFIQVVRRM